MVKVRYNRKNDRIERGKTMLYEYLRATYMQNEPIFVSDIRLPVSDVNLRQMFKVLCDLGKIRRFDTGIYYLPKESRLRGGVPLGADTVAKYKYISRNGRVDGYYSGYTFANQLGVTTQVPYMVEIVSNNASARVREVDLQGRRILLRKAKIPVTKENYRVLQLLDFLKDVEQYTDEDNEIVYNCIHKYIVEEQISKKEVDLYIEQYPDRIFRYIYEMRLYDVFA